MTAALASLPEPTPEALAHSRRLASAIHAEIAAAGGWLDFSRYMQLALYAPGLGYYSAGTTKFGPAGDFTTAPELGRWLGDALADRVARELEASSADTVLELGAGTGSLAAQLLEALAREGHAGLRYLILEPSADLRARQAQTLAAYAGRVTWLERLPDEPFAGVIIANEVLDALPAQRFVMVQGRARPLGVAAAGEGFEWRIGPPSDELAAAVADLERLRGEPLPDGYRSELRPILAPWLSALAAALERGALLFIDYGYVRADYYRSERSDGTLLCHYRHRAYDAPFHWPGLADITAWVDFSAVADAARAAGLTVDGFTTQGQFLLATFAARPDLAALDGVSARELAAFKTLVLPGEMGERFKLMLLGKRRTAAAPLPGRDFRDRL